jgi:hypothetical protein
MKGLKVLPKLVAVPDPNPTPHIPQFAERTIAWWVPQFRGTRYTI